MPTGPKGQNRLADIIGNAIKIAQIATGEVDDAVVDDVAKTCCKGSWGQGWQGKGCKSIARAQERDC